MTSTRCATGSRRRREIGRHPLVLPAWISANVYLLRYLVTRWELINRTAAGHRRDFKPVGVARPLPKPLPVRVVKATTAANYATTVLACLGVAHPFTGPINSALTWWTLTYRNSWSMVFHNDNTAVLHTAALAVSPAADVWSVDALAARRVNGSPPRSHTSWRYGWPMQAANSLTVATYFVSGVAKLRGPLGWRWASGAHLSRRSLRTVFARLPFGPTTPARRRG